MDTEEYTKQCKNCLTFFTTYRTDKIWCKITCRTLYRDKHQRQYWKASSKPKLIAEILERDGWWCKLCNEAIDPELKYPSNYSLSVDHIIPRAKGGGNGVNNLQPTHLICNLRKGPN